MLPHKASTSGGLRSGSPRGRSVLGQVGDLMRLRWSMLSRPARAGLAIGGVAAAGAAPGTLAAAVLSAPGLSHDLQLQASELVSGAFLVVAVGIAVAALASAGGRELVPRAQLWAYPVSPVAEHLTILLLTPANLAWWIQVLGLFLVMGIATAFAVASSGGSLLVATVMSGAVCAAWVIAATTLSQWLAWAAEIVRTLPGGRWALRLTLALIVVVSTRSANAATLTRVLGWGPPRMMTDATLAAAQNDYGSGLLVLAGLIGGSLVFVLGGGWTYRVLQRRPARDQTRTETRLHQPRALVDAEAFAADLRCWRRQDWALVWRSVPLRRGLLVLLLVPGAGGLLARVGVNDLALLSGVVAAGAGLLVGVNAMSLDAEGAPWRESLPVEPRVWLAARAWVLAEMVVATATLATATAALNATGTLRAASVVAAAMAIPTMTGQVLARCLRWSITNPQRAELRTARDSPTTPGLMVRYSAQLVGPAMFMAIVLALAARSGLVGLPVIVCVPSLVLSVLSIRRSLLRFDDHATRARIVQAVSRG